MRALTRRELVLAALLLTLAFTSAGFAASRLTAERAAAVDSVKMTCRSVEAVKDTIRTAAVETDQLRQRRKAGLTRAEKAAFRRQLGRTLRNLRPADCARLPIVRSTR